MGRQLIHGTGDVNLDPSYTPNLVSNGWGHALERAGRVADVKVTRQGELRGRLLPALIESAGHPVLTS
jgi:hypothetical protein